MLKRAYTIICMIFAFFLSMGIGMQTYAKDIERIDEKELNQIILDNFNWAKQGNDILLNEDFLAGVGMTDGDWFPICMGRYNYETETNSIYLDAIENDVTLKYSIDGKLDNNKTTEWQRIALAVTSMGGNPTCIGRDQNGNPIDLIKDGVYDPIVRGGLLDRQGINGAIWGLIAVDSRKYEIPEDAKYQREDILAMIAENQMSDGGFTLGGKPNKNLNSDPDITGMAIQALAPYYDSPDKYPTYWNEPFTYKEVDGKQVLASGTMIEKTIKQIIEESLDCISEKQNIDGDFSSWGTTNAESTVQMLVALTSLGINPYEDERFITESGKTLIDGILKYRMEDGGFAHSFETDPENPSAVAGQSNRMASEQVQYGLISYYRLINGMTSLYDFTDMPEAEKTFEYELKEIPWIEFSTEEPGSTAKQENLILAFNENTTKYTLHIPVWADYLYLTDIPFEDKHSSNLQVDNTMIFTDKPYEFEVYLDKETSKKYRIEFIKHYFAQSKSIIDEVWYLKSMDINSYNNTLIYEKLLKTENKYNELDFSYEKTYTESRDKVLDDMEDIKQRLDEVTTFDIDALLKRKAEIDGLVEVLPDFGEVSVEYLDDVELLRKRSEILIKDLQFCSDISESEDEVNKANDAIASLEESLELLGIYRSQLNKQLAKIDDLNERIEEKLGDDDKIPTIADYSEINGMYMEYSPMVDGDKKQVVNSDDLLWAKEIVDQLKKGVIPKEVFEKIKENDSDYVFQDKVTGTTLKYSFVFEGSDVEKPMDVKIGCTTSGGNCEKIKKENKDLLMYFTFNHKGEFPGETTITLGDKFEDGEYKLYRYDGKEQYVKTIQVKNGSFDFKTDEGGEYFITALSNSSNSNTNLLPDKDYITNNKKPSTSYNGTGSTNNVFQDIIKKAEFDKIKGEDENIKGVGSVDGGSKECSFIFNGKDLSTTKDFKTGVNTTSDNKKDILKLSPDALILKLEHEGKLPGETLFSCETDLKDGDYILFSYDEKKKAAVIEEKVTVEDGTLQFVMKENKEYFVAKEASLDSLLNTLVTKAGEDAYEKDQNTIGTDMPENEYSSMHNDESGNGIKYQIDDETRQKYEKIIEEILGEMKMEFTSDEVILLLEALSGRNSFAEYLTPIAIIVGLLFVGACILISSKKPKDFKDDEEKIGETSHSGGWWARHGQ